MHEARHLMNSNGPTSRTRASQLEGENAPEELATRLRADAHAIVLPPAPTSILYVPSKTPVGGVMLPMPPNGLGVVQLAQWESPDGMPRRVTVYAYSPFPSFTFGSVNYGVAVRLSQGGARGGVSSWHGCPCMISAVGTRITVDAMCCTLPFNFGFRSLGASGFGSRSEGSNGPTPVPPATTDLFFSATAVILDGEIEEPPGEDITNNELATWVGQTYTNGVPDPHKGSQAEGPCVVTACTITNTSASNVLMAIFDSKFIPSATIPWEAIGFVMVPAGSSVGVGRDLLGSFFQAFNCVGVTAASALAGAPYTVDANTSSCLVDVRGYYLKLSSGG
jgi:hypothetical protein